MGEAVGEERAHLRITGKEGSHHCYDLVTNHTVKEAGEVGDLRPKPGRLEGGLTVAGGRQRKGILSRRTMGFGFHHGELETLRRRQQNIYQDPGSVCANIESTFAGDMCWSRGRGGQTGRGSPSPVNKAV